LINEILFYLLAASGIMVNGISKSGFGGGLGVLSVPIMALVMSPVKAAAILLPLICLMDVYTVWHYRQKWDKKNLQILIPSAIVGIGLGSYLYKYLSDDYLRLMIGVISIVFVLFFLLRNHRDTKTQSHIIKGSFWGMLSGFTSFSVHAGGPTLNIYLLPQKLEKSIFVGTSVLFFMTINYIKLIPYAFLGQLNMDNLGLSGLLAPFAILGIFLGVKLHHRVNERLFYNLCYFFLFATGIKLLFDGFKGL
jgi:uncharacterized membrane protein YfcA